MNRFAAATFRLAILAGVFAATMVGIYALAGDPPRAGFVLVSALVVSAINAFSALLLLKDRLPQEASDSAGVTV